MTPKQIKQALNIRMLRAEKAERALRQARTTEAQAVGALQAAEGQLSIFDASYDARIAAFFEKTAKGVSPESVHSARVFHSDLAGERNGIVGVIEQAEQVAILAAQHVAEKREIWAAASRAAENIGDLFARATRLLDRERERREEQDADELSIARARRAG